MDKIENLLQSVSNNIEKKEINGTGNRYSYGILV